MRYKAKGLVAILPLADPLIWCSRVIAVLVTGNVPVLVDAETRIREVFSGLSEQVIVATNGQLAALFAGPLVRLRLAGEDDTVVKWCRQTLLN